VKPAQLETHDVLGAIPRMVNALPISERLLYLGGDGVAQQRL
jgi:hypothetical protein